MSVDPSAQSWDSKLPQSLNRYAYVRGNPVKYIDSDGEFPILILAAAGVVGGLLLGAEAANAPSSADTPMVEDTGGMKAVAASSTVISGVRALMELFGFGEEQPRDVTIDKERHPQSAEHARDAQRAGQPDTLTIDREGRDANRRDALRGTKSMPGKDRDEYPPAMFKEGGKGASVRHIDPSDNRGAGACMGAQCKDLPDGTRVRIRVEKKPPPK